MVAVADRIDGWRNDPPRRLIHRESFRASVLHHSGSRAVPQSIAAKKCLLTTPSLLSKGIWPNHKLLIPNQAVKREILLSRFLWKSRNTDFECP